MIIIIILVAGYADQAMCMRVSGTPTSAMVEALCTGMTGENATLVSGWRESSKDKESMSGSYKAQIMHRSAIPNSTSICYNLHNAYYGDQE